MDDFNLSKTDLIAQKPEHSSNLLSDSWDWVSNHKVETAVAIAGTAALAIGVVAGARALGARAGSAAETKALNAMTIELGGALDPALAKLATEGVTVRTFALGSATHDVAALENALDQGIFRMPKSLVVKLEEGFDPKRALAERAAALSEMLTPKPAPIKISWGKLP